MASQSLYRKWRSQTFSDLVGQEAIVETLKNELANGKLAHAYLFTGPRGTGKTSTARLLAKTLNCTNSKNGEPCNVCEQCREITAGSSFNVIEIDAASNRGIDSIRELRDKVMVRPAQGKYKIYILDEAHMLTNEAFNALLKTLEEPPEHAIFVMATTDVHKMLPTVISRCQQFNFKRITAREIVKHLLFVAQEEHIGIERSAAELIARAAAGGMRDALSLLDQAIAYSGQEITLTNVQTMLGVADVRAIQKIVSHIAHLESATGLHLIYELAEGGADLRQINTQVAEFMRGMMLSKAGANIAEILDSTEEQVQEIAQLASHFTLEELTDLARIFAQNDLMQKNQGTPQFGLELALLTSIERHRGARTTQVQQPVTNTASTPAPQLPTRVQPSRPAVAQSSPAAQARPEPVVRKEEPPVAPATSVPPVARPSAPSLPAANQDASATSALPDWDDIPFNENDDEPDEPVAPMSPPRLTLVPPPEKLVATDADDNASEGEENTENAPTVTVAEIKDKWELIKRRIKTKKDGSLIAAVLNDYAVVSVEGTRELPVVVLRASAKFHYDTLQKDERRKIIEWALKIELNQECQVRLLPPGAPVITMPLPPPTQPDAGGRAANSGIALSPMPSAHRERPTGVPTPPAPVKTPRKEPEPQEKTNNNGAQQTPPLARNPTLRENSISVPPSSSEEVHVAPQSVVESSTRETRPEVLEKKAKADPVVLEVMRMFKANVKEVHPK